MATVVVCDDDAVLRRHLSDLCEEAGLKVVAETDRSTDAVELVRRFAVDIVVLDLALPDGSGERVLDAFREVQPGPIVIVFTAYAEDPDHLIRLGAREVIEKPDFARLESVLSHLAVAPAPTGTDATDGRDRRRTSHTVEPPSPFWRSPSGISSSHDLVRSLQNAVAGDALLLIVPQGLDDLEGVGQTLIADCRLASARLLRDTLRVQDVVHAVPEVDGFVGLLRGGDASAAEAAWSRLVALHDGTRTPGHLTGAHTRVDDAGGQAAMARALAAVHAARSEGHVLLGA